MILLLDNYDSFVFNLARYLQELGAETQVVRSDALNVAEIERLRPQGIVISPGPCTPLEAGISLEVIRQLGPKVPILGVCLGHQAIAAALGGEVVRAPEPVHGRTAWITHHQQNVLAGLPNPFRAMRYHSLIVREASLPSTLRVVAHTADGIPMALEHVVWPLYGVQFHPESVLTEGGHQMLANFLRIAGISPCAPPASEVQLEVPVSLEADWHASEIEPIPSRPL
ncbi:MAG: aminodeoxychorismate/anthranilate synthase component II [Planctomycetota bacterium]